MTTTVVREGSAEHFKVDSNREYATLALVVIGFATLGLLAGGSELEILIRILMAATLAVAWNLFSGYAGLFSFGHAAYFGLGAYTSAYLLVEHQVSPWLGMVFGALVASAYGVVTTWLIVRFNIRGAYFALSSFAFAEILHLVSLNLNAINGTAGLRVPLVDGDASWSMMQFDLGSTNYLLVILGLFAVAMFTVIALINSSYGFRLRAMRDDPEAAEAAGIPLLKYSLMAAAISAAMTGAVGVFYVQFLFYIDPVLAFSGPVSVQILLPAIIGGLATVWGPLLGAAVIVILGEILSILVNEPPVGLEWFEGRGGVDLVIYGTLLVLAIMFAPRGLLGVAKDALCRLGRTL